MDKKSILNGIMALLTVLLFLVAVYRLFTFGSADWVLCVIPAVLIIFFFSNTTNPFNDKREIQS